MLPISSMKVSIQVFLLLILANAGYGQAPDKVSQIVAAENYFAALAKEKGLKKAFLKVADNSTIVFRPNPVSAVEYYKKQSDSLGILNWEPVWAKISKSGDWGFTTGPFNYRKDLDSEISSYGQYVSVWKKNSKGVWKLAVDLGIPHKKPTSKPVLNFPNPPNEIYLKQRSQERLQQREDIVLSSDKLFATVQKADNKIAHTEFLAEDARLLFPGSEPIIGKKAIAAFWQKQGLRASSKPLRADRSYSGELAYTTGEASIVKGREITPYNYLRVWEVQPGYKWSVILEIYVAAVDENP
ncbi:hypothetical protein [Pedobacter sp. SYSU D00535]|uniref:DUF4440 domain-containing protein n=1 Tax=Pedobacter sp. SYSU D00535 TaxID=2810308 RepID=UPI001A96FD61|nr:hypothetical protein [Pedobacter sp. SYSU D00535]